MATRKNSTVRLEPIKLTYTTRASRTMAMLHVLLPHLRGTLHEQPALAAIEYLEHVPRAFTNAEAKACLASVKSLLPSILGLTDPRGG